MDSPDRNSPASASEFEGSPLFNFLCSLSPIKPVKSARVVQTYSEISFPPPPPVFVSPKVDGKKESASLQRDKCTTRDEVETARSRAFLHPTERIQKFRGALKPQKSQSSASPCSSPSKLVKEYLAEPEDELQDNVNVEEAFESNNETMAIDDKTTYIETLKQEDYNLEQNGPHNRQIVTMEMSSTQNTGGQTFCNTISTHAQISLGSGRAKTGILPNFDNEASELEFLMSDEADEPPQDLCLENWQHMTSTLSELSVEQVEGYIASLRGMVGEQQVLAVDVSNDGLNVIANENLTGDSMAAEQEFKSDQGGVVAGKTNPPPLRGVRRRCLDFEVSEGRRTSLVSLQSLPANSDIGCQDESTCEAESSSSLLVLKKRVSATSGGAINTEPVQADACTKFYSRKDGMASIKMTRSTSINIKVSHASSMKDGTCATRNAGTSPAPAGMPSGIGLHLNSLTGGMPCTQPPREMDGLIGSTASYKPAHAHSGCSPRMERKSAERTQKSLLLADAGYVRGRMNLKQGIVAPHCEPMEDCQVGSECSGLDVDSSQKTFCVRSVALGAEQMGETITSNASSKGPSPLGRKRVLSQEVELEGAEESIQSPSSPKKKRRTASFTEKSGDGCKRCNCKKSKCLKLYCECFAAGVYCVGSCTCHDCFNKPEFEETVMDTRQQIQSRNPLAFAPKIIQASEFSPTKREACRDTPASARHKRGCNCKKSQCLKKYCECFQAGVGCSDGCRCENCQNVHGRKEGAEDSDEKDLLMEALVSEEVAEEHTDTLEACTELLHAPPHPTHDLSPITPAFQHTGPNRMLVKSSPSNKRRSSLDELHSPTFSLSAVKPSRSPSRVLRSCKGTENSSPMASSGIILPKFGNSPVSTPRILRIGRFSPRWDGLDDICTLTPGLQIPLRPTPASVSVMDKSECSPSINEQTCNEHSSSANPLARHSSKFTCLTSPLSHHESSQCQSPANMESTPLLSSPACPTDKAACLENSRAFVHQLMDDDGTPDFLKEPDKGYSPLGLVKSSSPKHKRISPPHHHALREASGRGLPSPGLRNSRKFILQSVPSVPSTLRE